MIKLTCLTLKDSFRVTMKSFLFLLAYFVPDDGRFTNIANIGDIDVKVEFIQVFQSDTPLKRWRLNGTSDVNEYFRLDEGPLSHIITHGLLPEDGGVYEVHVNTLRHEGRGGLLRPHRTRWA